MGRVLGGDRPAVPSPVGEMPRHGLQARFVRCAPLADLVYHPLLLAWKYAPSAHFISLSPIIHTYRLQHVCVVLLVEDS